MAAEYTASEIAKVVLRIFDRESGDVITHLYLQKILYYVQAWALAFGLGPVFDEDFQAWAHGPVVPEVFQEYKDYHYDPIPVPSEWREVDKTTLEHISKILEAYSQYSAKQLEHFTHEEDPWRIARDGCPLGQRCENIITKDSMIDYYSKQMD